MNDRDDVQGGVPQPLWPEAPQPAPLGGRIANPASAAPPPPPHRVIPQGFSPTVDNEYAALYGQPPAPAPAPAPAPYWQPQRPPLPPSRSGIPAALPMSGQVYAQVLRPLGARPGRWFLAWGIAIAFFSAGQLIALLLMAPQVAEIFVEAFVAGATGSVVTDPIEITSRIMSSPWAFLGLNLSWAAMIPGAVVALVAYGDKAMGYAFSVAGRWRWNLVARSLLVVGPVFALYIGAQFIFDDTVELQWRPDWLLIAIVLLTTPLQSAGEEFAFRGIVTQQLGGWMSNRWVASIVTGALIGALFGVLHLGYPPLAILQVALVGFTASMLTFRTGGLEAACVLHACNNVFIMLPLAAAGLSPFATSGAQPPLPAQLLGFAMALAALGLSYVLVHVTMRDAQRTTDGAPGADLLATRRQHRGAPALVGAGAYGAPPQQGGWQPPQGAWQQPPQQWQQPQQAQPQAPQQQWQPQPSPQQQPPQPWQQPYPQWPSTQQPQQPSASEPPTQG